MDSLIRCYWLRPCLQSHWDYICPNCNEYGCSCEESKENNSSFAEYCIYCGSIIKWVP